MRSLSKASAGAALGRRLAPELARVATSADFPPSLRVAATRSLGHTIPDPKLAADAVKALLEGRGVQFTEKDVSADQAAVFELVRTYNSRSTPTLIIGDEVLIGFDPDRIEKLLSE